MEKLLHPEDCTIVRDDPNYPEEAVVYDSEGDIVWPFLASWTDEQIKEALNFANHAHNKGFELGEFRKQREFQKVLGITK